LPPFPDIPFERPVRSVMDHMEMLVEAAGSNTDRLIEVIVRLQDHRYAPPCKDPRPMPGVFAIN
jgi:enamine deaminase RidA (YjgF/YER057c/UK114 family)